MVDQNLELIPQTAEDILHQVFDQSSQGFQAINREWKYVFVNETMAKQGRKKVEELIGRTIMEAYPGIEKTFLFSQYKKCMDEKVSIRMDNEFVFSDSSVGWFQLFIHPWFDGIIVFSADITKIKMAEEDMIKKAEEVSGFIAHSAEEKIKVEELRQALLKLRQQQVMQL